MDVWAWWVGGLATALDTISSQGGLSSGWSIVLLTLAVRVALLPLTLAVARRADRTRRIMAGLKPEIEALRERFKDDPRTLATETLALQRTRGVRLFDRLILANIASQTLFGLGMFRLLGKTGAASRFLWISNIALPDTVLALVTGTIMFLAIALAPGSQGQISWMMAMIPAVITVISLLSLPSAVGIYWAVSNGVSLAQAIYLDQRWRRSF